MSTRKWPKYASPAHSYFCLCCWLSIGAGMFYCSTYCRERHTGTCLPRMHAAFPEPEAA